MSSRHAIAITRRPKFVCCCVHGYTQTHTHSVRPSSHERLYPCTTVCMLAATWPLLDKHRLCVYMCVCARARVCVLCVCARARACVCVCVCVHLTQRTCSTSWKSGGTDIGSISVKSFSGLPLVTTHNRPEGSNNTAVERRRSLLKSKRLQHTHRHTHTRAREYTREYTFPYWFAITQLCKQSHVCLLVSLASIDLCSHVLG